MPSSICVCKAVTFSGGTNSSPPSVSRTRTRRGFSSASTNEDQRSVKQSNLREQPDRKITQVKIRPQVTSLESMGMMAKMGVLRGIFFIMKLIVTQQRFWLIVPGEHMAKTVARIVFTKLPIGNVGGNLQVLQICKRAYDERQG